MNIYFLVEGNETEVKLYPKWLSYLLPELSQVTDYSDVNENNYYILSGGGIPSIYKHVGNAISDINEIGKYDYFILVLDAEELSISERKDEIEKHINMLGFQGIYLENTEFVPVIQNRCIETWLLGNDKLINSVQAEDCVLNEYTKYYDITSNDPEKMGRFLSNTHAQFHEKYLKEILKANKMKYTKGRIKDVGTKEYFDCLHERVLKNPEELKSFCNFILFCEQIRFQMGK